MAAIGVNWGGSYLMESTLRPRLVITTCASRKRAIPTLTAKVLSAGPQSEVANRWLALVAQQGPGLPAETLYRGRAFGLAIAACNAIKGELGIISAGLGFVLGWTRIPAYDITVRPTGPTSIRNYVVGEFDATAWWHSVSRGPFAVDLAAELADRSEALVCLSQAYAEMVGDDLAAFARAGGRLRIFGLSIAKHLPAELRDFVLPYDERLDRLGSSGTRVDFPQRALTDYVNHIGQQSLDLRADHDAVRQRLASVPLKAIRGTQRRLSDTEVKALIVEASKVIGHSRTRLLSHLRHEHACSCEQSRFFRLCDDIFGDAS